MSNTHIFWVL